MSISLVIPTYNDEKTVVAQINECIKIIQKYCNDYEIIIADDLSKDNTRMLLKKYFSKHKNIKLVFNKNNLGITKNVRQLYKLAKKQYIFFYSADGDWDTKDVGNLIRTQIKTNADIVIGKRTKKIGYTPYRKFISFLHKLIPLILFGVNTIDPGGIKLVRRDLAQIKLISKSQFFEAEIIIRAKKNNCKISWYPIVYKKIFYGSGHGGALKDSFNSFFDILRLRFSTI